MSATKIASVAGIAVLGFGLAACGGGSKKNSTGALQSASQNQTQNQNSPRSAPGAFGTIAALTASDMQVQNGQNGQTQVTYGSTTAISQEKAGKLSDVTVGSCVVVMGTPASTGSTTIAGTSFTITQPVNGSCSTQSFLPGAGGGFGGGFGGGGNFRRNGASPNPDFSPRPRPSRSPGAGDGQNFRSFAVASGKVTGVSGTTVTVSGVLREPRAGGQGQPGQGTQPTPNPSPSALPTQTITVTTSSTTTYSETVKTTASALKVGECVAAIGKTNDVGAVAATSITIRSTATDCTAGGFGGGGFRRGFGGGGNGGGNGGAAPGGAGGNV